MSDERQDPHSESTDGGPPDASPGDAHIRALLADLGSGPGGEPMPPHVAARLDDTLGRLVAERDRTGSDPARPGVVVPLRRRWLSRAAAAAAAVVVVVLGGVTVANSGLLDSGSPTSDKASSGSARSSEATDASLPRLGSATFADDAAAVLGARPTLVPPGPATGRREASPAPRAREGAAVCPGPGLTDGSTTIPVRYDGRLAALVVHPARSGRTLVEAWSCTGDRRLAATRLRP